MADQSTRLDEVLVACLDAIETQGWAIEDCLRQYADYQAELEPLLRTAVALRQGTAVSAPARFRRESPARLQLRLNASARPPVPVTNSDVPRSISREPISHRMWRTGMSGIVALVLLLLGAIAGGTVVVADNAGPGDSLYGIDRAVENFRLGLTSQPDGIARLQYRFASERLEEASESLSAGNDDSAQQALQAFDEAIAALQALLDSANLSSEDRAAIEALVGQLEAARITAGPGVQNANTNTNVNSNTNTNLNANANANVNANTNLNTNANANANANTNVNANTNGNTNTNGNANTNSNTNFNGDDDDDDGNGNANTNQNSNFNGEDEDDDDENGNVNSNENGHDNGNENGGGDDDDGEDHSGSGGGGGGGDEHDDDDD